MSQFPFTEHLLNWYRNNARQLPWRGQRDPYAIWVSEIMLQQTRVETVIPYFERWIEHFPTVRSLAEAPLQEVLAVWEGLGYYSRARNLHKAARQIWEQGGVLPSTTSELRTLPGVGRYTAGAIASIAFGENAAALDGNIRRVLARLFDVEEPARSLKGEARLWELAESNLPSGEAGDYNQALMDLGATLCTPHDPDCIQCPLTAFCQAYQLGIQEQRPVNLPKPSIPHYQVAAAVLEREGRYLITQRPFQGLLGGLWEFPGGKQEPAETLPECLGRELQEELGVRVRVGEQLNVYKHAYTHFRVTVHAFHCFWQQGEPEPQLLQVNDLAWAELSDLAKYPMGKVDRQIASHLSEGAG
ncbi:MAG TPA: A/G-specific adenine glycosylase [Anaerolineales bacterium]|nr:A/G-specific adenine glycosylase [Anaerolineales bacterium]